ncbi:MAG: cobalamin biosynthesis protein, partial [Bacillota bacterium]|nr:cobalamin biosynthesis protein [Bacillota bacterium]
VKAALLALTDRGMITAQRIRDELPLTVQPEFFIHEKSLSLNTKPQEERKKTNFQEKLHLFKRLGDVVPSLWKEYSVLIFVMATGIVVRQIAPLIDRKDRDPAVLVLDEEGKFIIPLLSGHLGGANSWANEIACHIGAQAIITTATDGRGLVAPDEYARRYGWKVDPINHLPMVNRLLLERGFLNVWTSYPLKPEHTWMEDIHYRFVSKNEKNKANVILDAFPSMDAKEDCLFLVPPILSVGVGCRRGVSTQTILARITEAVEQIGATPKAISGIYSIDLKTDELGLIEAAKHLRVPFRTFRADELQAVNEQERLSRSNFVNEKIGVDGVCEAASLLGAHMGRLILPKIKGQGVTVAISMENYLS